MISLILLQCLYGTSIPLNKLLLHYSRPLFLTAIRLMVGGIFLYVSLSASCEKKHYSIIPSLIIGLYGKYVLKYYSFLFLPVTNSALVISLTPLISALLFEFPTKRQWCGIGVAFLGMFLITFASCAYSQILWGELLLIGAIFFHLYTLNLTKKIIKKNNVFKLSYGLHMVIAGGLALFTSMFNEEILPISNIYKFAGLFFVMVFINNVVCHMWYLNLLERYSITFLVLTDYLNVIASMMYGIIFLKETVSYMALTGVLLICNGIGIFYKQEQNNEL